MIRIDLAHTLKGQGHNDESPSIIQDLAVRAKRMVKPHMRRAMKDWSLGIAFPREYANAVAKCAVDERKVVCVDVKESQDAMPDAFELAMAHLRDHYGMNVHYVGLGQRTSGKIEYYERCLALMRDLADAKLILVCDSCDVVSCINLRPETRVIQLWHACGAFKKFGASVESPEMLKMISDNTDYLFTTSKNMAINYCMNYGRL